MAEKTYLVISNTKTVKVNAFSLPSSCAVHLLDKQPCGRSKGIRPRKFRQRPLARLRDRLRQTAQGLGTFGKQHRDGGDPE